MPLNRHSRLLPLSLSLLFRAVRAAPLPLSILSGTGLFEAPDAPGEPPVEVSSEFTIRLVASVILVLLGGVFAGLTIGLMGQDEVFLQVTAESGEPHERVCASKVLKLLSKGKHWVLVTLLLSNVITNETLPIVLDRLLGGGWPAVLSSTAAIVIFGEIIPQSICVRYGLPLGAYFAPFVKVLMYAMYPVAVPIARLLDYALGEDHGTVYKKAGLKSLVTLHHHIGLEPLNEDEVTIISAVLDLKDKPVSTIMTPIEDVFVLSSDTVLDETMVEKILLTGFNRIPVHVPGDPLNFIGMLLVRTLITYDPDDALPISSFSLATLPETSPDTSCLNILNYFQEGKAHMVAVSTDPGQICGPVGVVTLEDVIEELIGEEIVDESDVYVDVHRAIRRVTPAPMLKHVGNIGNIGNVGSSKAGLMHLRPSNRASDPKTTNNSKITIRRGMVQSATSTTATGTPPQSGSLYSDRDAAELSRSPGNIVTKTGGSEHADVVNSEREAVARNLNSEAERKTGSEAPSATAPTGTVADESQPVPVVKKKKTKSRRKQGRPRNLAEHTIAELKQGDDDGAEQGIERRSTEQSLDDDLRPSTFSENLVRVNGVNKVVIQEISSSSDEEDSSVSPAQSKKGRK